MESRKRYLLAILLGFLIAISQPDVFGKDIGKTTPKDSGAVYAGKLPDFSLQDPAGETFTRASLAKDGLVLVVTAPLLRNKGAQEGWDKYLLDAKSGSKAKLAYIEDMKPSKFKEMALKGMKKDYEPGKEPILLIDNDGELRRRLNVPEKKTVVLVYDKVGRLVHSEAAKPSPGAAQTIWVKVQ
jgi:cytochrome oxidase Cu insertion factor (SCO1/SenC/PrrC family)